MNRARVHRQQRSQGRPPSEQERPATAPVERTRLVCAGLLAITLAVFGQTTGFPFVNYDDDTYVYQNGHVVRGITGKNIVWAFTATHAANWHPLTWLSHMLDCQLYGLWAGGHHLTNVLLHAVTAVVLFLVLRRMTGQFWPSALVAALFAVHPLRVESVAWVAERKDVLSGVFFVLSLAAYVRYAQRPASWRRYAAVVVTFALGLMAKPMMVTLPAVLLLLDYWPLKRWDPAAAWGIPRRLILEKLPLFLLAGLSCVVTCVAQRTAMETAANLPLAWRAGNAVVAYAGYLCQMFWPCDLAVFYPHLRANLPISQIVAASLVLLAISAGVFQTRKQYPFLLVGWLWYLGMLVPVIGIVQVGSQAMADRYTYLPQIGIYLALVWGAVEAARERGFLRALWIPAAGVIVILMACAWQQTHYWQDSITLWAHALACHPSNSTGHVSYAIALDRGGRLAEAEVEYFKALELDPKNALALAGLGLVMADQGKDEKALRLYRQALQIEPQLAVCRAGLGSVLLRQGKLDEAVRNFRQALDASPDLADVHSNLGVALAMRGQFDEATGHCRQAIEIQPDLPESYANLANIFATQGRWDEAAAEYGKALAISPGLSVVRARLASVIYRQGRVREALVLTRQAIAEARAAGRNGEAQTIESQLRRYESGQPDHDLTPSRPSRPLGSSS